MATLELAFPIRNALLSAVIFQELVEEDTAFVALVSNFKVLSFNFKNSTLCLNFQLPRVVKELFTPTIPTSLIKATQHPIPLRDNATSQLIVLHRLFANFGKVSNEFSFTRKIDVYSESYFQTGF